MISIQAHLDMIVTEALESGCGDDYQPSQQPKENLPPIHYRLEFIEQADGTIEMVE